MSSKPNAPEWCKTVYKEPPWEVIPWLWEYIANQIHTFPQAKQAEFFVHFEAGVRDMLAKIAKENQNETDR